MKKWLVHFLTASRDGDDKVRLLYLVNAGLGLVIVVAAFIAWYFLSNKYFTAFNPFSYWNLASQGFLLTLWQIAIPLCLYAIFIGQLDWFSDDELEDGTLVEEHMFFKGFVSFCAGLIEEIGHRGIYIYFGLIAVSISNAFFGWIFLRNIVLLINFFFLGIYSKIIATPWLLYTIPFILITAAMAIQAYVLSKRTNSHFGIISFLLKVVLFTVWAGYAFSKGAETLIRMLNLHEINTLHSFSIVPAGADNWTALLYVSAVMWSNLKFRDSHKYQGAAGTLNSYVFGMYMIYIAFTYGLVYAIALHFLYDTLLFGSEHLVQVIKNRHLVSRRRFVY